MTTNSDRDEYLKYWPAFGEVAENSEIPVATRMVFRRVGR